MQLTSPSKSRISFLLAIVAALFVSLALVACGNDDDDAAPTQPPADATEPANGGDSGDDVSEADNGDEGGNGSTETGNGRGVTGSGRGTLSVDGQVFEFDVVFCGFDVDETGNENVPFSFHARGEDAGHSYSIDASTVEVADIASHSISMWYDDDPLTLVYETAPGFDADAPEFAIDGKHVSYEGDFLSQGEQDVGVGTLDATCP